MATFQLSSRLSGHEGDVRCIAAVSDDLLVSGSRDSTVRVWYRNGQDRTFGLPSLNYKSDMFVNSLAIVRNVETLVASSGNDNMISMSPVGAQAGEPEYCLVGHTANVCSLTSKDENGELLSSSWDGTAKVWSGGEVLYDLKGHKGSVWSAKFLPGAHEYITCGADRTVRVWQGKEQVKMWEAHQDVVRDLAVLPNGDLATCSNDSTIKIWSSGTYELKQTLQGHESFVYCLDVLPSGELVSCGEDRTVRVWKAGACVQTITLPCVSVWCVRVLPNGDIATGSSDAEIRIFTRDSARVAPADELAEFKKAVETSAVSENLYGQIKREDLPGPEVLNTPGKTEGQTKMVQQGPKVAIYQWTSGEWQKIGELVSSTGSDKKKMYNGEWYDYVFDVDIEDGKPPLKLPFNVTENPYTAAENFLARNNLPYSYNQQIVNFIMQNAEGATLSQEGRNGNGTGSRIPQREYLTFGKVDPSKVASGFRKLNAGLSEDLQMDSRRFETLLNMEDFEGLAELAAKIIISWPGAAKLVGFDILRVAVRYIKPFDNLFMLIKKGLDSDNPKVRMMALRVLVNVFDASWGQQTFLDPGVIDIVMTKQIKKDIETSKLTAVTVATFLMDYAVLAAKTGNRELIAKAAEAIGDVAEPLSRDDESAYRALVGVATLNFAKHLLNGEELVKTLVNGRTSERFEEIVKDM